MIEALTFVRGAVARKDIVPVLTHFLIRDGKVTGYNGRISLTAPIETDITAAPKADKFYSALTQCGDGPTTLRTTKTGLLSVTSERFRARVQCVDVDTYPMLEPQGEETDAPRDLVTILAKLAPAIGQDASRPWAQGILLRGGHAYATNNVTLVRHVMQEPTPVNVVLPQEAVVEILRIGEQPVSMCFADNAVMLRYEGGRHLTTRTIAQAWPESLDAMVEEAMQDAVFSALPKDFADAVKGLGPFLKADKGVYVLDNELASSLDGGEGAVVRVDGLSGCGGKFHTEVLSIVSQVADRVSFRAAPEKSAFRSEDGLLDGIFLGMRSTGRESG